MVGSGGENFVFWFSRSRENAFLCAFSKNFVFVLHMFLFFSRTVEGLWPTYPRYAGPDVPAALSYKQKKFLVRH